MNKDFEKAIQGNNLKAVRQMLKLNPELLQETNSYGMTPLMCAVSAIERSVRCVQILIDAGTDVNIKTSEGYTALHFAVDVDGSSCWGKTPERIIKLLVDAGAQLEERQHWGWTPLMRAVIEGTPDEVSALLAVGADPNKFFPQYSLPVFIKGRSVLAASIANVEVTKLLLQAGADVNTTDEHGQTVLEYAQQVFEQSESEDFKKRVTECIELIRDASTAR